MFLDDKLLRAVNFWYELSVARALATFSNAPARQKKMNKSWVLLPFSRRIKQNHRNLIIYPSSRVFLKGKRHLTGYSQAPAMLDHSSCERGFIKLGATCLGFASSPQEAWLQQSLRCWQVALLTGIRWLSFWRAEVPKLRRADAPGTRSTSKLGRFWGTEGVTPGFVGPLWGACSGVCVWGEWGWGWVVGIWGWGMLEERWWETGFVSSVVEDGMCCLGGDDTGVLILGCGIAESRSGLGWERP